MPDNEIEKLDEDLIRGRIYSIRGFQVMLDRDLAELYGVETKYLHRVVKRNIGRFPPEFCFSLNKRELSNLRCQFVTSSWGGLRYAPFAFSEHGVVMLSSVLKSERAVEVNIKVVKAFIAMRKCIANNSLVFQRLDSLEMKQTGTHLKLIETDKRVDEIFALMESGDMKPKQGIFFEGQIFDAYKFVSDLFRSAEKSILIIDNFIDDSVLIHLTKVKSDVKVKILTRSVTDQFRLDLKKFEDQYFPVEVKVFPHSHDRFIIIDGRDVYHVGASLKDLGKKWVGFSKFGKTAIDILGRLDEID